MTRLAQATLLVVLAGAPVSAQAPAARESGPESRPVAIVAGEAIDAAAIEELLRPQLMELRVQEQQLRERALEVLIAQALFRKEAALRGISEDALERQEIVAKVAVAAADAKALYEANRTAFGSTPQTEAIAQLQRDLEERRRDERRAAFVRELRARYDVSVLLEPMRVAVEVGAAPVRGNPGAPVTIVEFSDFECPYCVRVRPTVARLRATYGDQVRWAFRHFPLGFHKLALKAGEAAVCAGEQGKFWEMHDRLWASEGRLKVPELKDSAVTIGLDRAAFDRCLDSGRHAELVQRDLEAGMSYGVSGTPAFFVNGRPLVGAQGFETFQRVIDDELKRLESRPAASK